MTRLGKLLVKQRDRVYGEHCIEQRARIDGIQRWGLRSVVRSGS